MKTFALIIGCVAFYLWLAIKLGKFCSGDYDRNLPDIEDVE